MWVLRHNAMEMRKKEDFFVRVQMWDDGGGKRGVDIAESWLVFYSTCCPIQDQKKAAQGSLKFLTASNSLNQ